MNRLFMYLPPFAGDYSGVCSTFYELGGMICIHDAAGCTGNYTGFDEPRWYGSNDMVYCTGLRKIDAALGNDEKFIKRIADAAMELKPNFIAIVGSPVPFIIGFDYKGVAREIEAATGIPTFGFNTNGLQGYYKDGIVMATETLLNQYALKVKKKLTDKIKVNIIGATPLDISDENYCMLEQFLYKHEFEINSSIAMHTSLEQITKVYEADVNIAISQAGLITCIQMEKHMQIPYIAGLPIGEYQALIFAREIKKVCKNKKSLIVSATEFQVTTPLLQLNKEDSVLILGDAVVGKSIQNELYASGVENIDIFTLFGSDEGCRRMGVASLHCEVDILDKVNDKKYKVIIADPLITDLRANKGEVQLIELPQYGISSKLSNQKKWNYIDSSFNQHLNKLQKLPHNI